MNSKRIDISVGSSLCVFSASIFTYAQRYKGTGVNQYGPNFFPQVLAIMMFVASVLLIVNALRGESQKLSETIDKAGFIRATVTVGISIVYLVLMQVLGFLISTVLFLFGLMTFIGHKGLVIRIISSGAVTVCIYSIFYFFLKIPIPNGILF